MAISPIKIGEVKLLDFKLEGKWHKKELWQRLMDTRAAMEDQFNQDDYMNYYLKIQGHYYDPALVPEEYLYLAYPYNPSNRRYDDYNGLREEKIPVLVLYSDNCNFRDYGILCSYFTDKPESNTLPNIELWGKKASWINILARKLGLRA